MATRSAPIDRDFRTATALPETWDEDTRSIEVVFSTGPPKNASSPYAMMRTVKESLWTSRPGHAS